MKLCTSVAGGLGIQVRRLVYRDGTASCLNPPLPHRAFLSVNPLLCSSSLHSARARAHASSFLVRRQVAAMVLLGNSLLFAANVPRCFLYHRVPRSLFFLSLSFHAVLLPNRRYPSLLVGACHRCSAFFRIGLPASLGPFLFRYLLESFGVLRNI